MAPRCLSLLGLQIIFLAQIVFAQQSAWEPMNRGLQHLLVYTIEIDPVDSLVMYSGTDYGNLYKSTDGGFNWIIKRNGIPSDYDKELVSSLYLDRGDRKKLFCGFGGRQSKKNLFKSSDGAESWDVVPTPSEWESAGILNIFKSFGAEGKIFCGLGWYKGIYCSSNEGTTWNKVFYSKGVQVIAGHPGLPSIVFAGTSSTGALFRSTDAGLSWREVDPLVQGKNGGMTGVRAITVAAQNPNLVFVGITGPGKGLAKSTDAGLTWEKLNEIGEISEIAVHPNNHNIIYISAIGTGVHRSTDGGVTWVNLREGMPTTDVMRVRIAPGYPLRVFAVTLKHGIYRLVDEELTQEQLLAPERSSDK